MKDSGEKRKSDPSDKLGSAAAKVSEQAEPTSDEFTVPEVTSKPQDAESKNKSSSANKGNSTASGTETNQQETPVDTGTTKENNKAKKNAKQKSSEGTDSASKTETKNSAGSENFSSKTSDTKAASSKDSGPEDSNSKSPDAVATSSTTSKDTKNEKPQPDAKPNDVSNLESDASAANATSEGAGNKPLPETGEETPSGENRNTLATPGAVQAASPPKASSFKNQITNPVNRPSDAPAVDETSSGQPASASEQDAEPLTVQAIADAARASDSAPSLDQMLQEMAPPDPIPAAVPPAQDVAQGVEAQPKNVATQTVAIDDVVAKAPSKASAAAKARQIAVKKQVWIKSVLIGVAATYLLLAVGWSIDGLLHRNETMRGVTILGTPVSGLDKEGLIEAIDEIELQLEERPVEITAEDFKISTDPVTLGISINSNLTAADALQARRDRGVLLGPIRWFADLFKTTDIEPLFQTDSETLDAVTANLVNAELQQSKEHELVFFNDDLIVEPGNSGRGVSAQDLNGKLQQAMKGPEPYKIQLEAATTEPYSSLKNIESLATEINEKTSEPVTIEIMDISAQVEPRMLRSWVEPLPDPEVDGGIAWEIDAETSLADLQSLFPRLGTEDQQARFDIVDDKPVILPATETVICCAADFNLDIASALDEFTTKDPDEDDPDEAPEAKDPRVIKLKAEILGADKGVEELEVLGIVEEVSSFTTKHKCCENRVRNIQRFADLTQGQIIKPGEEFSLNGFVGQRTREKGFYPAGAIAQGNIEDQVGGGISQYATTFFNASFYSGIDILEYQSHSLYISRYPRGREATMSWRKPDLRVRNNTDYGILIWNTYTSTSITVTFYSTKHVDVVDLPLKLSYRNKCKVYTTPRVITHEDDTTSQDSVFALYRPSEGLDCNGNSTTPEKDAREAEEERRKNPPAGPSTTAPSITIPTIPNGEE